MQDYIPRPTDINDQIKPFTVKQYDNNSRKVYFNLIDKDNPNEQTINLESHKIRAYFKLPDGGMEFTDGEIIDPDEGRIAVTLPNSVTQQIGTVECEVGISGVDDNTFISLRVFRFDVLESIRDDAAIEATEQFSALESALRTVDGLDARINNLVAMADAGEIPAGSIESEVIDARCGYDSLHDAVNVAMNSGGATEEQLAQIEQNKQNIDSIKESVYTKVTDSGTFFEYSNPGQITVIPPVDGVAYVGGKNLLANDAFADYTDTIDGVTLTVKDGVFTLNGTASAITKFNIQIPNVLCVGKTYTILIQRMNDGITSKSVSVKLMADLWGSQTGIAITTNLTKYTGDTVDNVYSFCEAAAENAYLLVEVYSDSTINNFSFGVMLTTGESQTDYEYSTAPKAITETTTFSNAEYI